MTLAMIAGAAGFCLGVLVGSAFMLGLLAWHAETGMNHED